MCLQWTILKNEKIELFKSKGFVEKYVTEFTFLNFILFMYQIYVTAHLKESYSGQHVK